MLSILKIAAGVLLGLVVVLAVLYVLARLLLMRLAATLRDAAIGADGLPPERVRLRALPESAWSDLEWVEEQTRRLEARGFRRAGDYAVEPMRGVRVRGLVHVETPTMAAIAEHRLASGWIDIVRVGADDSSVLATNAAETGVDPPPWKRVVREDDADADRLYELVVDAAPEDGRSPFRPDEFATMYEQAYAREMDWMVGRGGPSEREIHAVAALSGQPASAEAVSAVRDLWAARAEDHREQQWREALLHRDDLAAVHHEVVREGLVFVHDELDGDELDQLVADALDWEDHEACARLCAAARRARAQERGRRGFEHMNASLPEALRFRKLAELTEPAAADVYLEPVHLEGAESAEGPVRHATAG